MFGNKKGCVGTQRGGTPQSKGAMPPKKSEFRLAQELERQCATSNSPPPPLTSGKQARSCSLSSMSFTSGPHSLLRVGSCVSYRNLSEEPDWCTLGAHSHQARWNVRFVCQEHQQGHLRRSQDVGVLVDSGPLPLSSIVTYS